MLVGRLAVLRCEDMLWLAVVFRAVDPVDGAEPLAPAAAAVLSLEDFPTGFLLAATCGATYVARWTSLDGRRLRYIAEDMPAAYLAFRALVGLAAR